MPAAARERSCDGWVTRVDLSPRAIQAPPHLTPRPGSSQHELRPPSPVAAQSLSLRRRAKLLDDAVADRQPRPVPLPTGLVVKKGSKMRERCSGAMPGPLSRKVATRLAVRGAASSSAGDGLSRMAAGGVVGVLHQVHHHLQQLPGAPWMVPRGVSGRPVHLKAGAVPLRTQWMARSITPPSSTGVRSSAVHRRKALQARTMSAVRCAPSSVPPSARAGRPAGGRCAASRAASPSPRRRPRHGSRQVLAQPVGVALQRMHVAQHEADRVVGSCATPATRRPSEAIFGVQQLLLRALERLVRLSQLAVARLSSPIGRPTKTWPTSAPRLS